MAATATLRTTYNVYAPRTPSPLNPAASSSLSSASPPTKAATSNSNGCDENYTSGGKRIMIRKGGGPNGSASGRPQGLVQKMMRRRAARTMHTNSLRRQVESYESKALQSLSSQAGRKQDTLATAAASASRRKKGNKPRRRWATALWVLLTARPVVSALSHLWPFQRGKTERSRVEDCAGSSTVSRLT